MKKKSHIDGRKGKSLFTYMLVCTCTRIKEIQFYGSFHNAWLCFFSLRLLHVARDFVPLMADEYFMMNQRWKIDVSGPTAFNNGAGRARGLY